MGQKIAKFQSCFFSGFGDVKKLVFQWEARRSQLKAKRSNPPELTVSLFFCEEKNLYNATEKSRWALQ